MTSQDQITASMNAVAKSIADYLQRPYGHANRLNLPPPGLQAEGHSILTDQYPEPEARMLST